MSHIVILSGSPKKNSRLNGMIQYAKEYAENKSETAEILHIIDLPAQVLIEGLYQDQALQAFHECINKAKKIIVATQVYKASFTGVLKTYLDLIPPKGFKGKDILPIVLGGSLAHYLMLDNSLKPVLASLEPDNIRRGVYTIEQDVKWVKEGRLRINEQAKTRLDKAFHDFLDH
ncbi:FMN reductase [Bacillus sp. TS-2]|nr:FMN reductase [Bacillus sp. TS-2]